MKQKFIVTGMSCAACSARVEGAVRSLEGALDCSVNLLTGELLVEGEALSEDIKAAVINAGYGIKDDSTSAEFSKKRTGTPEIKKQIIRLIISLSLSLALMYVAMGHMIGLPPVFHANPLANGCLQLVMALIVMVLNRRFFISGVRGVLHKAPNMDTLVALGSLVSFVYSVCLLFVMGFQDATDKHELLHGLYFESAAMILALISLGKLLEAVAKGKTTGALEALIDLTPSTATLLVDGKEVTVNAKDVKIGDIFVVRPGEKIPCDGEIISGSSGIDESSLTGESVPAEKGVGDAVFASCINKSGFITCKATATAENTVLAGIIKMVSDATATKAPIARLADRVAGVFVPVVICISLLTLGGWILFTDAGIGYAIQRATTVLVISCPCALGLATPVAIMVGSGVGARQGILFKTASAIELAGRVKTVVLDKTGTVTEGKMSVTDVVAYGTSEDERLSYALGIERYSEHPIAVAICDYAKERDTAPVEISDFSADAGRGVIGKYKNETIVAGSLKYIKMLINVDKNIDLECERLFGEGKTVTVVLRDLAPIGIIAVADKLKRDAKDGVAALKKMGIYTVLLSGDNAAVANAIGSKIGIDEIVAEVLPSGKEEKIRELSERGRVCMVGDGINDAPALSRADVGIAIGCGTDIAMDSADIIITRGNVLDVACALKIGRGVLLNIKENLFFAFLYNCIGIPLAIGAFGVLLPPMFGALAMSLSSFCVVTNALRLNFLFYKNKKEVSQMKDERVYNVKGMMCPHCEARVKAAIMEIDGVSSAVPSHKKGRVTVTLTRDIDDCDIIKVIEAAGYKVV